KAAAARAHSLRAGGYSFHRRIPQSQRSQESHLHQQHWQRRMVATATSNVPISSLAGYTRKNLTVRKIRLTGRIHGTQSKPEQQHHSWGHTSPASGHLLMRIHCHSPSAATKMILTPRKLQPTETWTYPSVSTASLPLYL